MAKRKPKRKRRVEREKSKIPARPMVDELGRSIVGLGLHTTALHILWDFQFCVNEGVDPQLCVFLAGLDHNVSSKNESALTAYLGPIFTAADIASAALAKAGPDAYLDQRIEQGIAFLETRIEELELILNKMIESIESEGDK